MQPTKPIGAFKRLEAAEYCRISASTFHRIGPVADVAKGRIRLWTLPTLDKWLTGPSHGGKRR
jgi:hypothetical protein